MKLNSKPDFNTGDAIGEDRLAEAVAAGLAAARGIAMKAARIKRAVKPQVSAALREVLALVPGVKAKLRKSPARAIPALRNLSRFRRTDLRQSRGDADV
jgi:hypothetical protein